MQKLFSALCHIFDFQKATNDPTVASRSGVTVFHRSMDIGGKKITIFCVGLMHDHSIECRKYRSALKAFLVARREAKRNEPVLQVIVD